MAKVISVLNNKGGTGKTTTAINFGASLSKRRKKVLLIDLDSQCNLSTALGILNPEKHVGHLLLKHENVEDIIQKNEKLSLIPSSNKLLDYEMQINSEPGRDYIIREALRSINGSFDYIILDCPPSLGVLTINALVASDLYIVPMQTEHFAFIGLDTILHTTEIVQQRMNPGLDLAGILFNRFSGRTKFGQAVISSIEEHQHLEHKIFKTKIRQDIALMESAAFNQTIYAYAPKSRGAFDYDKFTKEFIQRYGK